MRIGEDQQGVAGLHQAGIPDEYEPSLSVRFMGIDDKAIISYLVERAGGRTWCRTNADDALATGQRLLEGASAGRRCTTELAALARMAASRTC